MKNSFLLAVLFVLLPLAGFAQDKPAKFTVTVSADSILMGNYFEVKFSLENAGGKDFEAPDFGEHFKVVSGPTHSTSMSIVNGELTQSATITYYLEPKDPGVFYILPASINTGDTILETDPLEVMVVPNPDGIEQRPPGQAEGFQFNWSNPFDFDFDFLFPEMKPAPPPAGEELPKEAPRKKLKTIRI